MKVSQKVAKATCLPLHSVSAETVMTCESRVSLLHAACSLSDSCPVLRARSTLNLKDAHHTRASISMHTYTRASKLYLSRLLSAGVMDIRMDMQQLEQRMQKIERAMRAAAADNRQAFLRVETVLGGVGRVEQAVMNLLVMARALSQAHPSHANEGTHVPPSSAPLRKKTPPPTPPDSKEKVFYLSFFLLFWNQANEAVARSS